MPQKPIYPIPPGGRNTDERRQSNAATQARVLVNDALILHDLNLPKSSALFIFRNSQAVIQFVEAAAALRCSEVEDHVVEGLLDSVWGAP
jgi:hypothetical protein